MYLWYHELEMRLWIWYTTNWNVYEKDSYLRNINRDNKGNSQFNWLGMPFSMASLVAVPLLAFGLMKYINTMTDNYVLLKQGLFTFIWLWQLPSNKKIGYDQVSLKFFNLVTVSLAYTNAIMGLQMVLKQKFGQQSRSNCVFLMVAWNCTVGTIRKGSG